MTKERPLRFFSITDDGRADKHFYVAAYSIEDACVLLSHARGLKNPHDHPYSASHLSSFGSKSWGSAAKDDRLQPVRRGVFVVSGGSIYWKERKGIKVVFVEPPAHIPAHVPNASPSEEAARQPIPETYGKLESGVTKQAKIDEWTFSSPHLKDAAKFRATVYLVRGGRRFHGRLVDRDTSFTFVAESEVFEDIEDTDIDQLRTRVAEAFALHDLSQRGIVWEDWFEVAISTASIYESTGAGFAIGYQTIKRGIHPRTGEALTIESGIVKAFPKPKAAKKRGAEDDEDDVSFEDRDRRDDENQYAYIPATAENLASLEAISGAIRNAHAKLALLLAQKSITNTLASVPSIPLLEAK